MNRISADSISKAINKNSFKKEKEKKKKNQHPAIPLHTLEFQRLWVVWFLLLIHYAGMRLCLVTQILTYFYNSEMNAGEKRFPPGCLGP